MGLLLFQFSNHFILSQNIEFVKGFPSVILKLEVGKSKLESKLFDLDYPICQKYSGVLRKNQFQFIEEEQKNIFDFFSGKKSLVNKVLQFLKNSKIDFLEFNDLNFYLTNFLKATKIPQGYIFDSFLIVKFKGLI